MKQTIDIGRKDNKLIIIKAKKRRVTVLETFIESSGKLKRNRRKNSENGLGAAYRGKPRL